MSEDRLNILERQMRRIEQIMRSKRHPLTGYIKIDVGTANPKSAHEMLVLGQRLREKCQALERYYWTMKIYGSPTEVALTGIAWVEVRGCIPDDFAEGLVVDKLVMEGRG